MGAGAFQSDYLLARRTVPRGGATYRRFRLREWKDVSVVRVACEPCLRLETLSPLGRCQRVLWNSHEAVRETRLAVVHPRPSGGRQTNRGARVLELLITEWRGRTK